MTSTDMCRAVPVTLPRCASSTSALPGIQNPQIGQPGQGQRRQTTLAKAEVDQQSVVAETLGPNPAAAGVQVAELRVPVHRDRVGAGEGQTLTGTLERAAGLTVPLVVLLGTVGHPVTHVVRVKTDPHPPASVETRAHVFITPPFVLTSRAVVHPVTKHEYG